MSDTPRGGWRDIESAPRDGTAVLVYEPAEKSMAVGWWEDHYVWVSPGAWITDYARSDTPVWRPTHWQPLPSPPETENG